MSKYNDTILTSEGTRLATLAANGKTHYVITRAVATGDDLSDLTDEQLAALTKLPNEVQEGSIVEQVDDPSGSDGVIGTRVQFVNQGLSKSYSMNALGVYAKEDGHDQEVLFSVMTAESQHAQYMPDFADKVVLRFGITIFVIVGDKANVTVKLDPDGLATIKFVEDAIAAVDVSKQLMNYQTPAITAPSGDVKSSVNSTGDLTAAILALPRGINSVFVNANANNNPAKASLHGTVHVFNAPGASASGKGALFDATGNMWTIVASGSTVSYTRMVKDNGDGSVNLGDKRITPPDEGETVKHDDSGTLTNPLNARSGDLTIDGKVVMPIEVVADKTEALVKGKLDKTTLHVWGKVVE